MKDLYNPNKWTAFVIYADLETQQELIRILRPYVEKFDHYNFNFYADEIGTDHLSIRVRGKGKKHFEEIIKKHLLIYARKMIKTSWQLKPYDYRGRKNYELATRCVFAIWKDKKYYEKPEDLNMIELIHGIFDNLSYTDREEGKIHLKMAWHFLVKKPFYLKIRKLKAKFK